MKMKSKKEKPDEKTLCYLVDSFQIYLSEKSLNVIWSISGKSFDMGLLHQRDSVISIWAPFVKCWKNYNILYLHYWFKLLLSKSEEKKISGKTFQVPNYANCKFRPHRIRVRCFETFLNSWRRRRFSVMLWYCLALKQPSHQVSTHSMNRKPKEI